MNTDDAPELRHAFERSERDLLVRYSRIGCILILILVPAGMSLDYVVYPQWFWSMLGARVLCTAYLLLTLILFFTPFGDRYARPLSALGALAPMICICWMIYRSEGAMSPYYAGLNLIMIGICQFLPYSIVGAFAYCATTLISYGLVCFLRPSEDLHAAILFNNLYFIVLSSILCVTACHFATRRRFNDFRLRFELDVRNQRLTELDRLKSEFFANVSHEVRTPLTLILSPIDSLLLESNGVPAQGRATLEIVRQNGLRLLRLVNDLLEIVRLDGRRSSLLMQSIPLEGFLRGLADSVRALADKKQLRFEIHPPPEEVGVMADAARLEKIILNLLTNAIKFTPSQGLISLRWFPEGDNATIEIGDTGIGIAAPDLTHIFDRFRQVDGSLTRQFQGLGLGLALSRELAREMHGDIVARSEPGRGSVFTVRLPSTPVMALDGASPVDRQADIPVEVGSATAVAREGTIPDRHFLADMYRQANCAVVAIAEETNLPELGQGRATILVVDDEPDMRQYLASTMASEHRVMQAADGLTALRMAKEHRPWVILLDQMLPKLSGSEVCRRLRSCPETQDVKVVMLTARVDDAAKLEALEAGVDDFVSKPFSMLELRTRIQNQCRSAELQLDLQLRQHELHQALVNLKQAETQLVQSEKLNALGRLSSGLLHEINNPLNYTLMAAETLLRLVQGRDQELEEIADDTIAGLKRIATIVSDLRTFAYPEQSDRRRPFDVSQVVAAAVRFTAHELQEFSLEVPPPLGLQALGSATHITHVLVNMLVNSAHAVRRVSPAAHPQISIGLESRDARIVFRVRDRGEGIAEEVLPRIFDPFFTTRDVGEGMGLGLSICHTIVRNHGGTIRVHSHPAEGTEFTFDVPAWTTEEATHD